MRICVYGAASPTIDKKYIELVEKMGQKMANRGHSLVFGGGGNGLMGAAARGMTANGGYIIGIVPKFLNADGVIYDKCDELHFTDDMRSRKLLLEDEFDELTLKIQAIENLVSFAIDGLTSENISIIDGNHENFEYLNGKMFEISPPF